MAGNAAPDWEGPDLLREFESRGTLITVAPGARMTVDPAVGGIHDEPTFWDFPSFPPLSLPQFPVLSMMRRAVRVIGEQFLETNDR